MTSRKIKHARALAKREDFMQTIKEGNLNVLKKIHNQREEEEKRKAEELRQKKIEKSKKLAQENDKPLNKKPKSRNKKRN